MLELQNFLKMKISSLKILEISGKVLRKISGTFVSEKITSPSSPVSGKIFAFRKIFFGGGGGLEWKGAQILEYTPPQPETGWHGPDHTHHIHPTT
jgi:hypothetical protein